VAEEVQLEEQVVLVVQIELNQVLEELELMVVVDLYLLVMMDLFHQLFVLPFVMPFLLALIMVVLVEVLMLVLNHHWRTDFCLQLLVHFYQLLQFFLNHLF
jgi:hypothetical protein